jgi:kumamolisin
VLAASGDEGSDCGVGNHMAHVLYPASDTHVIGIGGTTILDLAGAPNDEVPWTRGGGGISDFFDVPDFQLKVDLPLSVNSGWRKRGVPDFAGYADPGFSFIWKGTSFAAIGTSLTTPLYAGLVAQLNSLSGARLGYITPILYAFSSLIFKDVGGTTTNSYHFAPGYHGGAGWDARTGLGVIKGATIQSMLKDGKL